MNRMKLFSNIIEESRERKNYDSISLLSSEINQYMQKVKALPKSVKDVLYITQKYNITSGETLQDILDAKRKDLEKLSSELSISIEVLDDLQKQLKGLKRNIRLLPHFQTEAERKEIEAGKLAQDDLTIDLKTDAGRNAAAKQYTPLVFKIANSFIGKSKLDRAELISAGMIGLAQAINDYNKEKSNMSFKSYAAFMISYAIQNDIRDHGFALTGYNWDAIKNTDAEKLYATSIDSLYKDDDDSSNDHLSFLGIEDDDKWLDVSKDTEKYFQALYKVLDNKFSARDCDIFYRFYGLNGRAKEKSKDIAKSYGMSEGNIRNSVINKMLTFIKKEPKLRSVLQALQRTYYESVMKDLVYLTSKEQIYESLINDDMIILLEELNRWNNKNDFRSSITNILSQCSIDDTKYIIECLEKGFEFIDNTFKKHKKLLIFFLSNLYPTNNIAKSSDVAIIDAMVDLSNVSKEFDIKW